MQPWVYTVLSNAVPQIQLYSKWEGCIIVVYNVTFVLAKYVPQPPYLVQKFICMHWTWNMDNTSMQQLLLFQNWD